LPVCFNFYCSLSFIGDSTRKGIFTAADWFFLIADMVKFYEGGLSFQYAKALPLSELMNMKRAAHKINEEIRKESEKNKRG